MRCTAEGFPNNEGVISPYFMSRPSLVLFLVCKSSRIIYFLSIILKNFVACLVFLFVLTPSSWHCMPLNCIGLTDSDVQVVSFQVRLNFRKILFALTSFDFLLLGKTNSFAVDWNICNVCGRPLYPLVVSFFHEITILSFVCLFSPSIGGSTLCYWTILKWHTWHPKRKIWSKKPKIQKKPPENKL